MQINNVNLEPGRDLFNAVRAAFVLKDDSLTAWSRRSDLNVSHVKQALHGTWNGTKGKAIRAKAIKASGLIASKRSDQYSTTPVVASN